jgi:hypothetical protein
VKLFIFQSKKIKYFPSLLIKRISTRKKKVRPILLFPKKKKCPKSKQLLLKRGKYERKRK